MKSIQIIPLVLCFWMFSCGSETANIEETPQLEKFELTYFDGGGMINKSERIFISDTLCYWQYHRFNRETLVNYQIDEDEMKALADFLIEHHYDEIVSEKKGFVADRGGSVISIKQESGVLELNNNGSYFIEEKWMADFNAIKTYLHQLNDEKVDAEKVNVSVQLDESLFQSSQSISCDFNGKKAFESIEGDLAHTFEVKAYPGLNELTVYVLSNDSTDINGKPAVVMQQNLFVECTEGQQVTVGILDKKIVEFKD